MPKSQTTFPAAFDLSKVGGTELIGTGDGISVSIWEAGSGGLFTSMPSNDFVPGARAVVLPEQVVSIGGDISVPYVGRVHVAGAGTQQAEETIRAKLVGKAIQPQVIVTVVHPISNTVSVTGEVTAGARVPLGPLGQRVLDVIASAGGIHIAANSAVIRITRNGATASIPFMTLLERPDLNIFLQGGDVVTVVMQPMNITALGATSRNAIVPFETVSLMLDQAIAKAGGLLDQQADPKGVYVFRFEPASVVERIAPLQFARYSDEAKKAWSGPDGEILLPVVYRLDLNSATSFFIARRFEMHDKDMIYVSNARATQLQKLLNLFNTATSPVVTGAVIKSSVK